MNDNISGGSFSLDTYISKQESLLLDFMRKQLQADTKVAILEAALQELYKKNEALNEQIEQNNDILNQSIAGLQITTNEKDSLQTKTEQLQSKIDQLQNALKEANVENNNRVNLEEEIKQLNNKLQITNGDYSTLKENYHKVLAALEEVNDKPKQVEKIIGKLKLVEKAEKANVITTLFEEANIIPAQDDVIALRQKRRSKKLHDIETTQIIDSGWIDGKYEIST